MLHCTAHSLFANTTGFSPFCHFIRQFTKHFIEIHCASHFIRHFATFVRQFRSFFRHFAKFIRHSNTRPKFVRQFIILFATNPFYRTKPSSNHASHIIGDKQHLSTSPLFRHHHDQPPLLTLFATNSIYRHPACSTKTLAAQAHSHLHLKLQIPFVIQNLAFFIDVVDEQHAVL